jgi:hypothetical protein
MTNITSYRFGQVDIDGKAYTSDVIISVDKVHDNWWRREGHTLDIEDLDLVLEADPQILVVGSGYYGRMQVPQQTRDWLRGMGMRLEVAPTSQAIEQFNELQRHCASVVAALHLTC